MHMLMPHAGVVYREKESRSVGTVVPRSKWSLGRQCPAEKCKRHTENEGDVDTKESPLYEEGE